MKHDTYQENVTAGGKSVSLTRSEVARAVFQLAYNREPTSNEMERSSIHVGDRHERSGETKVWELVLSVDELPSSRNLGKEPANDV